MVEGPQGARATEPTSVTPDWRREVEDMFVAFYLQTGDERVERREREERAVDPTFFTPPTQP